MSFFEERARLLEMSTETNQLRYCKVSHSTGEGERYEEGTLALVFLRCLREGLQFALSSNDSAGGKFDDLVLCWKREQSPHLSALFVQLKHKTTAKQTTLRKSRLMGDSNDFSIKMYYKSYNDIRSTLHSGNYAFVLSTNIDLDKDAKHMFVTHNPDSVSGMKLLEAGGCCYKLNPDDEAAKRAVQGDHQFMQRFYLFCNQSNYKTIKDKIYAELKLLLGTDEISCKRICENLCSSLREWMNTQDLCLTNDWKGWLSIADTYIKTEVTSCNSLVTRIKYRCVEALQAHIRGCNPTWIRPPGEEATALSATKVHQIICDEKHIMVSVTQLSEMEEKVLCCWGPFCQWLVLVDNDEHSYDTLLHMEQLAGPKRRLVIVSYKVDDSFPDTCRSADICDNSWKELIDVKIKLNSEQHLCCLEDLCDTEALKAMLDGKPEALVALSQLSGPVRVGQDLDPLPENYIPRRLTSRMHVRQEFLSSRGYKEVCIMDEVSYNVLSYKCVLKNTVNFEELENCLSVSDAAWPLFVVTNNIDISAVQMICSKHVDILVYILSHTDDGWEIHRGSTKIRSYVQEKSRSLLQIVDSLSNIIIVDGKPGVGKSTMLIDVASQLKNQHSPWWILRIDLLRYSEVFDSCGSGVEVCNDILARVVYNEKNLGILEHSLLQHSLLEYPHIICLVDGFDEVCPDYADKCLEALQQLAPRRGKLVVTTRPSVTGRLEAALGVLAHSLPAFSEEEVHRFHGWSHSQTGVSDAVRDLLKIALFSRMYKESLESGIVVDDVVSLYETFFESKFRRLYEEKWNEDLSKPGKKRKIQKEQMEQEKHLGFLAVSQLLPRLQVPYVTQLSSTDSDDLVKAGIIYEFVDDEPVFIHRTFAEHFLAKWCFSDVSRGFCASVYRKALSESSLDFFVESFDRMASRGRPLLTAVISGSESEVISLLRKGEDPAEVDVMGRNSLHLAAAYGHNSIILQILVEGPEVTVAAREAKARGSAAGPVEVTLEAVEAEAIFEVDGAVRSVEKEKIKQVASDLGPGETLGAAGQWGDEGREEVADPSQHVEALQVVSEALGAVDGLLHWTPLRYAAASWRWSTVAALLEMGAQLRHLGDFQRGLLSPEEMWHIYKKCGYEDLYDHIFVKSESVRTLNVKQRIDNLRCSDIQVGVFIICAEMSAEQYEDIETAARDFGDVEVAKLLKLKVLELQKKSTSLGSPALELHQGSSGTSQLDDCRQMVLNEAGLPNSRFQQVTTAGVSAMRLDEDSQSMLHDAARRGDAERVRQMVDAGADVNMQNEEGKTALHLAAVAGNAKCIEFLRSAGADVSMEDNEGQTPLHCAAAMGRPQNVKLLLDAGADALAQDSECRTPLHLATSWGNTACVRLLACAVTNLDLPDKRGLTALHYAAENGDNEIVKHLLRAGAHSSPVDNVLGTPLHAAACRGYTECVKLLVEAKADLTAKESQSATALHLAASVGSRDCVRLLLKAGADIQEKDKDGNTPLLCAARSRSPDCIGLLIAEGADLHDTNNDGDTPLHRAAARGNSESVRLLLEAEADIEQLTARLSAQNNCGDTPLHRAASCGNSESVRLLLEAEACLEQVTARVRTQNYRGDTPLHNAATWGNSESVGLLIEAGTYTEQVNTNGNTPLHLASMSFEPECVKRLLQAGARVTVQNNRGNTPLHCAANIGSDQTVELLLDAGADIGQVNTDGDTPLHLASKSRVTRCVSLLLEAGERVTVANNSGNTPLHYAAMKGRAQSINLLLDAGADIEQVNENGDTPLHLASESSESECVRQLLEAGATVITQNNCGATALHCAAKKGMDQIVKMLLDDGADTEKVNEDGDTPLHLASACTESQSVKQLLDASGRVSVQNNRGYTPLHYAAKEARNQNVKILLDAGADIEQVNENGDTPLHLASESFEPECVKRLLEAGARVTVQNNRGDMPLHCAAKKGIDQIVKILLDAGADVEQVNEDGDNPLHLASVSNESQCVRRLLEAGGKVTVQNNRGDTPLHCAAMQGQAQVLKILLEAGANPKQENKDNHTPLLYAATSGNGECVKLLLEYEEPVPTSTHSIK